jgi:hypothetical protein
MTATTGTSRVFVTSGLCGCHSVPTTQVHHGDFPEVWAEGETPADAADFLIKQLTRNLDSAASLRRRGAVESAINDVRAFAASLRRDESTRPA